ncbi:hypothetical protein E2562_026720, partial [Oryza meyeriana var. granulata]
LARSGPRSVCCYRAATLAAAIGDVHSAPVPRNRAAGLDWTGRRALRLRSASRRV